jgi:hypothetical protein
MRGVAALGAIGKEHKNLSRLAHGKRWQTA